MSVQLPEFVREAVRRTWQAIGPDVLDGCVMEEGIDEPLICYAEACIDAGHLTIYGGEQGQQADEEIDRMMDFYGQDAVLRAIADQCL